jgi:hypothetical protein
MSKVIRTLVIPIALVATLASTAATVPAADQACQPGIAPLVQAHAATFVQLINAIVPQLANLNAQLAAVVDQPTYEMLLATANGVAAGLANGRLVVTLPDGTVVVDTARDDNTADPKSNSFAHFQAKTINENHNSRLAIFSAQAYACGLGAERKFSSSTGNTETYLAVRLGGHLDSNGTARVSLF